MNAQICLLKIPVQDLDRAVAFYKDALGWTFEFSVEEYGWAQFQIGPLSLALYQPGLGGGNRTPGGSVDFQIAVDDLATLHSRLKEQSPDLKVEIYVNDDETRTLEFQDPEGNEWKISQLG